MNPERATDGTRQMSPQLCSIPYVLIADDEEDTRIGLGLLIQKAYPVLRILQADSGLQAWDIIRANDKLAVVFVDIRMPGLDGLQVCEKMQEESLRARRVIISGFRDFDYARQALRCGVSDYLLKPVNPADVIRLVREAIEKQQAMPADEVPLGEGQARLLIEQVCHWIHDQLDQDITLTQLSQKLHYTPNYLGTLFKEQTGKGFHEYLTDCRLQRATHLLKQPSLSIAEVGEQVGYTNAKAFSMAFRKSYGITPTEYREKYGRLMR